MAAQPTSVGDPFGTVIVRMRASLQDLFAISLADDARYELVKGVLIRMPPPQEEHGQISSLVIEALAPYCRAQNIRANLVSDIGYQLQSSGNADTVLAPDVSIFTMPKAVGETYSTQPPRLAVEIASPSQSRLYLKDKAEIYLLAGTAMVWVIWPDTRTVDIWTAPSQMVSLTRQATLDGGAVLPGFHCLVAALFP
jgi:Uma2 family endonuclease